MTKVTLVYPSATRHSLPPLGVAYLAAVARNNGHDVDIIDFNDLKDAGDFGRRIARRSPDVVGFSVQTNAMRIAFDCAETVRKLIPESTIIFGGPHPTVMPEHTLKNSAADIVIIGEGEETFAELLDSNERGGDLKNIKGVMYKKGGKLKLNERRPFMQDLDKLPFPARDLLPMQYYLDQIPAPPFPMKYLHIHAHRGCPFNCLFCQPTSHKMWGRAVRKRSAANICDEAEIVIDEYKPSVLQFSADTFTVDKKWVKDFCDEYRKRGFDTPWVVGSRIDTVDYNMLKDMKRSGCIWLGVGVESGSQKILDFYNKGTKVEDIKRFFAWCNEIGILTMANIMLGAPIETRETLQETIDLIKEIKPDILAQYFTNPICGTYLYEYAVKHNILKTTEYDKLSRHSLFNMELEHVTYEDLKFYNEKLFREYAKLKMRYLVDPTLLFRKKHHLKIVLKRLWSLRNSKLSSYRKSYDMLQTYHKNPVNRLLEMLVKGF